jgi:hypothetical protein
MSVAPRLGNFGMSAETDDDSRALRIVASLLVVLWVHTLRKERGTGRVLP